MNAQYFMRTCAAAAVFALLPMPALAGEEAIGVTSDPLKVGSAPRGSEQCKAGYVWRMARPTDKVCVTPQTRTLITKQNRAAARLWVAGASGNHTCVQGYVWREAFPGDDVCVFTQDRKQVRLDNAKAASRRVGG
jgi:hypothetical protein